MNNRVNRIKWSKLKLKWEGRLGAAHAFMGIKDYEEWAMGLTTPQPPPMAFDEETANEWLTPEEFGALHDPVSLTPKSEKELLFEKAVAIREQLDKAIADDEYEKASLLQRTLDVIELKYNRL